MNKPTPATSSWKTIVNKAIEILQRHIVPDGISDSEAITELYGLLDGPELRAVQAAELMQDKEIANLKDEIESYRIALGHIALGHPYPANFAGRLLAIAKDS